MSGRGCRLLDGGQAIATAGRKGAWGIAYPLVGMTADKWSGEQNCWIGFGLS